MLRVIKRFIRAYDFSGFKIWQIIRWSFSHTEFSNYYYKITPRNIIHMNFALSLLTDIPYAIFEKYTREILNDQSLKIHFNGFKSKNRGLRDARFDLGRRIFWYSLIRATKPRVVIETGISHGVGSCVIAQALLVNASEGYEGKAFGTEINVACGGLVVHPWNNCYQIKYGDSITTLNNLNETVDIFINDSDHDPDYEFREYEAIKKRMSKDGIFIADNAHATDSLVKFSIIENRMFLFVPEFPMNHWYRGGGVGISLSSNKVKKFRD